MSIEAENQDSAGRATRPAGDGASNGSAMVKVWDAFVRVFHWSSVSLFATAFLTSDVSETVHIYAGYGVLLLVALRLVWGIFGTKHARFSDFVYRPSAVIAYMREAARFRAKRYLGHNPAGGAMVVALLAALSATGASGYMMTLDRFWGQKWIEEAHEVAAHATLLLIALHVAGVIFSSLEHRENLVRSMFTGRKRR